MDDQSIDIVTNVAIYPPSELSPLASFGLVILLLFLGNFVYLKISFTYFVYLLQEIDEVCLQVRFAIAVDGVFSGEGCYYGLGRAQQAAAGLLAMDLGICFTGTG